MTSNQTKFTYVPLKRNFFKTKMNFKPVRNEDNRIEKYIFWGGASEVTVEVMYKKR